MSATLIPVIVAITKGPSIPTPNGVAFASTSVVVTDSTGVVQKAVLLTGKETPTPWAFSTSVAPGIGSVTAVDLDVNGAAISVMVTQTFTEVGSPPTFLPTTAVTVTPTTAAAAAAASVRAR